MLFLMLDSKQKNVPGRGFEPPWVAPLAPKASVSTIPPPRHI
jgi:hypothetical protein